MSFKMMKVLLALGLIATVSACNTQPANEVEEEGDEQEQVQPEGDEEEEEGEDEDE